MKRLTKVMSVVLAFIMLFGMTIYSNAGPAPTYSDFENAKKSTTNYYLLSDYNRDGEVTAEDARMILRAAVDLEHFNPLQVLTTDYDGDGSISAEDARMALRTAVGLEPYIYIDKSGERYGYCKETGTYYLLKDEGFFSYTGQKYKDYDAIPEDTWYIQVLNGKVYYEYKPIIPAPDDPPEPQIAPYTPETDPYYYMPDQYDIHKELAGFVYNEYGIHCDLDDIEAGRPYFVWNSSGHCEFKTKPGGTPIEIPTVCPYCGKPRIDYDGEHFGCWYGGCSRWMADVNCPDCGAFVKANTCHTCKH